MKTAAVHIGDTVDKLLGVLDRDIEHIRENLSRLDNLRGLVIKRDDVSLGRLLEAARSESDSYRENESKRRLLRGQLAVALGCSVDQMTLSTLEAELSGEKKARVAERKTRLQALAEKLRKEHLSTAMLLSDCARFNSVLLKGVLELGEAGAITYSPKGSVQRQINAAFVDSQF